MKKKMYFALLSIIVFIVLIFSATFAYFYADVQEDNPFTVTTSTPTMYSILLNSSDDIELYINEVVMLQSNVKDEPIANDNTSISITLRSGDNNDLVSCSYNIALIWDSEEKYMEADKILSTGEFEYSVYGTDIDEIDLSDLDWTLNTETGKYQAYILTDDAIETNSVDGISKTYNLYSNFYNLDVPQDKVVGKFFQGHFEFADIDCNVTSNFLNR